MTADRSAPAAPAAATSASQAEFGARIARTLSRGTDNLHPDLAERLRISRLQALELARVRRLALIPATPAAQASGTLTAPGRWWQRLGIAAPALVLAVGLLGIQVWHEQTQIQAAAEIDAALLSDDVPPTAYTDPGFIEFLREAPQ